MERSLGKSLDSDRLLLGEIKGSITMKEWPGIAEWRGRFWLPDGGQVRPGVRNCLIPDDGWAREPIAKELALDAAEAHFAVDKDEDHSRFE